MQPKNSTESSVKQAPLVTEGQAFHTTGSSTQSFFAVAAGIPVADALKEASCFLAASSSLLTKLIDDGLDTSDAFAIQFLVEAGKALLDSTATSIEFGLSRRAAH